MLNYRIKTPIRLISLILAQVFLLTGVVYPESNTNKNTSSVYIQAKDLRVPMMGAEGKGRLSEAAEEMAAKKDSMQMQFGQKKEEALKKLENLQAASSLPMRVDYLFMDYKGMREAIEKGDLFVGEDGSLRFTDSARRKNLPKLWYHGTIHTQNAAEKLLFGDDRGRLAVGDMTKDQEYAERTYSGGEKLVLEFDFSQDPLLAIEYFNEPFDNDVGIRKPVPLWLLSEKSKKDLMSRFTNLDPEKMAIAADSLGVSLDKVYTFYMDMAKNAFLQSKDIRALLPLIGLVRTGAAVAIKSARDIILNSENNSLRYKLLKELNFADRKNNPAARKAIEELTPALKVIVGESKDDELVVEAMTGLVHSAKKNFQPAVEVICSLFPRISALVLNPLRGTSNAMPQALEALTYFARNGNSDAIKTAQGIFISLSNAPVQYRILESITAGAKQGYEPAIKAVEELLPYLADITMSSQDQLLNLQIISTLSFSFQKNPSLASESISGLLNRLTDQVAGSRDNRQKIQAMKILGLAFGQHMPLLNDTVEILAPRMIGMITESQNDQLTQSALEVLLAAASNNSRAANDALKEISRILMSRAGLKNEGGDKEILKKALKAAGVKIKFNIYEISSARAAKGLIESMGWDEEMVVIGYSKEMDEKSTRKEFSKVVYENGQRIEACGYKIETFERDDSDSYLCLEFHDDAGIPTVQGKNYYNIAYNPFKFGFLSRVPEQETEVIKNELNTGDRKIIILASPSDEELGIALNVCDNLQVERPLLIVAPRHRVGDAKNPSPVLDELLKRPDAERRTPADKEGFRAFPDMQGRNVLILDTMGELMTMFSLADVSIVGEDRNITEPASQAKPVLYFEGEWRNNREARDLFVASGAIRVFSEENLTALLSGKEASISMVEKGLDVVSQIREQPLAQAADNFSSRILLVVLLKATLASNSSIENDLEIKRAQAALARGNFKEAIELTQKVISSYLTIRNTVNEKFPLWRRITDEKLPEARELLKEAQVGLVKTVVQKTRSELKKILNTPDLTPAKVQDACGVASALGVKIFKDSAPQDTGKTLHQAFTIFDGHRHAFVVVGYPGRNYYLIDVTFAQFFNEERAGFEGEPIVILKEMKNAGHPEHAAWSRTVESLISDGFIELRDEVANMYGTLLRGKYPSGSLSFNVDDMVNSRLEEPDFTDRELESYASGIDLQTGKVVSPETFAGFLKEFFTGRIITARKTGEQYTLIPGIAKDTPSLLQVYLRNSDGVISEEPVYRFLSSTLEVSIDLDAIHFGDSGPVSLTDQKLGTQLQKIFSSAVPAGFVVRGVVVNKETRENIFENFEVKYDLDQDGGRVPYVSTRKGGLRVVDKNPGPGQVLLSDIIGRETLLGRLFGEANFGILKIASYITGEAKKEGVEALLQLLGNTEHPQALFIRNAAGQTLSQFLEDLQMSNPEVLKENMTFFNRLTGKVETMSFMEFLKILRSPKKVGIFISPETQEYLERLDSAGLSALPEEMLKRIPDAKALGLGASPDKIAKFLETLSTPQGLRRYIAEPYKAELKIMLAQKQNPENKKQYEALMQNVSRYQALMLLIIYRWDLQSAVPVFGLSFVKTRDAVLESPAEIRTRL